MAFDDGRLDDEMILARHDAPLRHQAEAGSRVRREAVAAAPGTAHALEVLGENRPRAVIAAGPDSRLLRAVLEPVCPVPFLAWPGPGLPGWAGPLDLVVVLAPHGGDPGTARGVAEASRRGCAQLVACPERSLVAEHATGRSTIVLPTTTGDQLATAVVVLALLDQLGLAPQTDAERVATALDDVAIACGPHQDLAVNPAKIAAIGIADTSPLIWGGTVLAARAGRRIAEAIRRATGRAALAADAEHLLPVLEATAPADIFADPVTDGPNVRPALVVLDDRLDDPIVADTHDRLVDTARSRAVRVERISVPVEEDLARYAALLATGTYTSAYLQIGQSDPG